MTSYNIESTVCWVLWEFDLHSPFQGSLACPPAPYIAGIALDLDSARHWVLEKNKDSRRRYMQQVPRLRFDNFATM